MSKSKTTDNDFSFLIKEPEKRAKTLIRKITHSGETDLNKEDLNELKSICKSCDDSLMVVVFQTCKKCLQKDHAQVRVSTLKLLDYLFQKSHVIRNELLDDFDVFLELTLAISNSPKIKLQLPPPKKYAALLQELTAKAIHRWYSEFSLGYEKLRYAYKYLKEHKLVDFGQFQVRTHEQQIKQQKLAERQEKILTRSIENRLKELQDLKPEIEQILVSIDSLIDVLLPTEDTLPNLSEPFSDDSGDEDGTFTMDLSHRQHGIASINQGIEIQFSPFMEIIKNPDNKEIVQNLKELKKQLVEVKMTKLIAIEKTLIKRSDQLVNTLRDIIDLKNKSMNSVMKLSDLRIIDGEDDRAEKTLDNIESDEDKNSNDSEDEFEDVEPKEGLETYIPKSMRYEYGLEPIDPRELETRNRVVLTDESFDASTSLNEGASTSTSSIETNNNSMVLTCNVRMESGKLCPRRDKSKCPFHGRIIARDHRGVALDEEERKNEELAEEAKRKTFNKVPEWQDPELLRDISAATGVDLRMPAVGKRKKISPNKNLADTKICDLTPKQRLQKRLKQLNR